MVCVCFFFTFLFTFQLNIRCLIAFLSRVLLYCALFSVSFSIYTNEARLSICFVSLLFLQSIYFHILYYALGSESKLCCFVFCRIFIFIAFICFGMYVSFPFLTFFSFQVAMSILPCSALKIVTYTLKFIYLPSAKYTFIFLSLFFLY